MEDPLEAPSPKCPHQLLGPASSCTGATGSWGQPEPGHSLGKGLGNRMTTPAEVPFSSRVEESISTSHHLTSQGPWVSKPLSQGWTEHAPREIWTCHSHWPDLSLPSPHSGRCNFKSRPVCFKLPLLGTPSDPRQLCLSFKCDLLREALPGCPLDHFCQGQAHSYHICSDIFPLKCSLRDVCLFFLLFLVSATSQTEGELKGEQLPFGVRPD